MSEQQAIGTALKTLIEEKGVQPEAVAAAGQIGMTTLRAIFKGEFPKRHRTEIFARIASFLGISSVDALKAQRPKRTA